MNVTIGGKEYPVSYTLLDTFELGKAGVHASIRKFNEIEDWERLGIIAAFISTCVRRAGGTMTTEDFLLLAKTPELVGLYKAMAELMAMVGEDERPNEQSPGATAT